MKLLILSSDSEIASTKRLLNALKKSKFETEVLNPHSLHFEFGHKCSTLFHMGKKRALPDLVLPRLGWKTLEYGLQLARFFESCEIPVVNSADSLTKASDKLCSLQIFSQSNLPVPQTKFAHLQLPTELHLFAKQNSQVFKTLKGSQGFGVIWQESLPQSKAQMDAFRTSEVPVLTQELIFESFGEDVRAFVINGKVVAAMKRSAPQGELRSNLHQNGKAQKTKLTNEEKELAIKACKSLNLHYAGVDFLRTSKGPLLLEANPSPGFDGISEASALDVAKIFVASLPA